MTTYYVFNESKWQLIQAAMQQKQGEGFFTFTTNNKLVTDTQIPISNTDSNTVKLYRVVLILETDFAPQDEQLRLEAEANSEIYSTDNLVILEYLNTPDIPLN